MDRADIDAGCPGWQLRMLLVCMVTGLLLPGCTTPSKPGRAEPTLARVVLRLAESGNAPAAASWNAANAFQIATQASKTDPGAHWAADYWLEGLYDIEPAAGVVHFRVDRARFVRGMPLLAMSREPAIVVVGVELGLCHFMNGNQGPWDLVADAGQRRPVLTLDTSLQPLTEYTLPGAHLHVGSGAGDRRSGEDAALRQNVPAYGWHDPAT